MNGMGGPSVGGASPSLANRTRRLCRCCGLPTPPTLRTCSCTPRIPPALANALIAAAQRLDLSIRPSKTIDRVKAHQWTWTGDAEYAFMISVAGVSLYIAGMPILLKLLIVAAYTFALLIPLTSQFFFPASPVFTWLVLYFSSRFIPSSFRSHIHIWVSILPTLESVLYGANISDILTRWTHPLLDVVAWLPYGVLHFVLPFVVAGFLFVFGGPGAVKFFGKAFGYLNLAGVLIQIFFPCAPPWYELIYGITPASYSTPGSAGGLARIDALFGGHGYQTTFAASPVVFGAFPSLHAGNATLEALFLSHYFPRGRIVYWTYAFVLYWSTMYLSHHYLVDLVAGGSLAIGAFYLFLTDDQRHLPMLNAHAAGEDDALAKGYRTGVKGMLGHRGATGLWTMSQEALAMEFDLDDEEEGEGQAGGGAETGGKGSNGHPVRGSDEEARIGSGSGGIGGRGGGGIGGGAGEGQEIEMTTRPQHRSSDSYGKRPGGAGLQPGSTAGSPMMTRTSSTSAVAGGEPSTSGEGSGGRARPSPRLDESKRLGSP